MIRSRAFASLTAIGLLAALAAVAGCDSNGAQDGFLDQAFARPFEGITETTSDGEVLEEDEDDWRVSPFYVNTIDVGVAFPNPTGGELVTLELQVLFDDAVRGQLELWGYTSTQPPRLRRIDAIPESRQVGLYVFRFNAATLIQEPGLRRFFVYDRSGSDEVLVTYGDVMLE